jgi:L-fucose isomerase-like protein
MLVAGLAAILAVSNAEARQSTLNMTCAEATALVQSEGGIVLSTGEFTYERYVSDQRSCLIGEGVRRTSAPTSDNARCQLGNVCVPIIRRKRD